MKTVTYRGPDGWFRIDEPETVTFDQGVPVKVSDEVAEAVADYPGHEFEVGKPAAKRTTHARKGSTDKE